MTDEEYRLALSLMTSEKRAEIERKKQRDDRRRSAYAELIAKREIAKLSAKSIENISLSRTERGKPYLIGSDFELSVSHSGDFIAVALDEVPVGIDIEVRREINKGLVRKVCTEREVQFVNEDESKFDERFLTVWTAKEAYFKCIGSGITELKRVDYFDIKDRCETAFSNEYIVTVYR